MTKIQEEKKEEEEEGEEEEGEEEVGVSLDPIQCLARIQGALILVPQPLATSQLL